MTTALRLTAPILLLLGTVGLALSSTACGSAPDSRSDAPPPAASASNDTTGTASVIGTYQADGAAPIQYLQFVDETHYAMLREASDHTASTESGTYAFDPGQTNVTFSPDGGTPYTVPFVVADVNQAGGQAATQSHPLGAGIVNPGGLTGPSSTLTTQASRLTVDGASVQLVGGVMGYCPDGSHIPFPTLETGLIGLKGSNCAFKDGSGAVMTIGGKVARS